MKQLLLKLGIPVVAVALMSGCETSSGMDDRIYPMDHGDGSPDHFLKKR